MRDGRVRAFWMTLLFYALAGPLVGLLSFIVIGFLIVAWGPIIDRLEALIPHAQSSSCGPYSGHVDLRCFQLPPDLRQFTYPWLLQRPLLSVFFAYVIGFIPASLAGLFICAGRLRDGGGGFSYAVLVGTLVGFMTAAVVMLMPGLMSYKLESAVWFFFLCLIATIVCWLVAERWWRKAEITDVNSAG